MSSPQDIIPIPWSPGDFARRALVEALDRAGRPPINSAGRLKDEQQRAWDNYQAGTGSPADDPSRPDRFPLAHVRFVAADIDPTPERVRRLSAQGLVRPYNYEPWHWQLPNVYAYALVESIPSPAFYAILEEDFMAVLTDKEKDTLLTQITEIHRELVEQPGAGWTRARIFATGAAVDEILEKTRTFFSYMRLKVDALWRANGSPDTSLPEKGA